MIFMYSFQGGSGTFNVLWNIKCLTKCTLFSPICAQEPRVVYTMKARKPCRATQKCLVTCPKETSESLWCANALEQNYHQRSTKLKRMLVKVQILERQRAQIISVIGMMELWGFLAPEATGFNRCCHYDLQQIKAPSPRDDCVKMFAVLSCWAQTKQSAFSPPWFW